MRSQIYKIIVATLVMLSMVTTTPLVIGEYEELEVRTPGVNIWEGGGHLIDAIDTNDVLKTSTEEIKYNETMNIEVNQSLDWSEPYYFIWCPQYEGNIGESYELNWVKWKPESGPYPTIGGDDFIFEDVYLNCSGIWIIDNDNDHDASNISNMNDTIPAWFWVNGTENLDIQISDDMVDYDEEKDITVTVRTDGELKPVLIDVRDDTSVFKRGNIWANDPDGKLTFSTTNFTHAGEYSVCAYRDYDDNVNYYQENPKYFYEEYGNGTIDADKYNYTTCGPWDPPEYFAETETITVETGEPDIDLFNTDNIYWGFHAIIDVNITDNDGNGLENGNITIRNRHGKYLDTTLPALNISNLGNGNYTIEFAREAANWSMLDEGNMNGTWYVYYYEDINGDGIEEWNNSKSFIVSGTAPGAFIEITNDGCGNPTNKKVNVKDYQVDYPAPFIEVNFTIFGSLTEGPKAYYGDNDGEDGENITISGDILYEPSEDDGTLISHDNGKWTAMVVPVHSGEIEIEIDWKKNGTDKVEIEIENGTFVSTNIDSFVVDENATVLVTVVNMNNNTEEFSDVYLFWEDGELINHTSGNGKQGKGKYGIYKFIIDTEQQRDLAPQDIIIAADTPGFGYWGYTEISMIPNSDLVVNCTPTTGYAGDDVEYTIEISTLSGDAPETEHLMVELYNEDDDIVWSKSGSIDIEVELSLANGTYRLYAHNYTHDSKGQNETITILPYEVTCSPSVLAWLIDDDVNVTFNVYPNGDGTLKVYNITSSYKAAIEGDYVVVDIDNGTGILEGVNATELGNITFSYRPYNGEYQKADGMLKVTTAKAKAVPSTVYTNEATVVTVTITHPATGEPIEDVDVKLQSSILISVPENETTNKNGKVEFGITTGASGDIIILMEGDYDPDNKYVIKSATRKDMTLDCPLSINEKETITVLFKYGQNKIENTTITVRFAGTTYNTDTGMIELKAPEVTTDLDYRLEASADGYTDEQVTIRVINVPKLSIIVEQDTIKVGEEFSVLITDDSGKQIIGAKVLFDNKEYTTGVNGKATLTAPDTKGNYTIEASLNNFEGDSTIVSVKSADSTPGFEIIMLVVSICISLVLIRKKQKL